MTQSDVEEKFFWVGCAVLGEPSALAVIDEIQDWTRRILSHFRSGH